ncbi:MAG: MurT ligase domain-containing protein [Dehalococcoidia bacterium]|nr:MurT ligase domain-containing protein [Dehalococcoidia bacterium]
MGVGRATATGLHLLRRGGTALPGLLALRVDPRLAAGLGRQLGGGRAVITGTNGKTTTARMLAAMLEAEGRPVLQNREGSNLMRGIAGSLLARSSPGGRIRGARSTTGIFECDEATTPQAAADLAPDVMAVTNLFRDQLDRYGEVDTVAGFWRRAMEHSPPDMALVLNADDPSVAELGDGWSGPVHYTGIDDPAHAYEGGSPGDARWCRACGGNFAYSLTYFGHVGHWRCTGCGRARPAPDTRATDLRMDLDGTRFHVDGLGEISMPLTGLYNVWNALAAIGSARVLGISADAIRQGLAAVRPAFGRQETVALGDLQLRLLLAKNPAGANQVVRLLAALDRPLQVAVLLNDRFADGQDVSWTWDVDYELLAGRIERCWVGGDRAEDMALRLKYAGWPAPSAAVHEPAALCDAIEAGAAPGDDVFVLPTYSALLDFRAEIVRRGGAKAFWSDE